jgi:tetrahydromethanopterin S-methyltransferase subunit G
MTERRGNMSSYTVREMHERIERWMEALKESQAHLDKIKSELYEREKRLAISISLNVGLAVGLLMFAILELVR